MGRRGHITGRLILAPMTASGRGEGGQETILFPEALKGRPRPAWVLGALSGLTAGGGAAHPWASPRARIGRPFGAAEAPVADCPVQTDSRQPFGTIPGLT